MYSGVDPVAVNQKLGVEFVSAYYKTLVENVETLYQFYEDDSSLMRVEDEKEGAHEQLIGQLAIHEKVTGMGYVGAKVKIESTDVMESAQGSVVVLVTGVIALISHPARAFVQTFLLMPGEGAGKYYVRSDILRLLSPILSTQPSAQAAAPTSVKPKAPRVEKPKAAAAPVQAAPAAAAAPQQAAAPAAATTTPAVAAPAAAAAPAPAAAAAAPASTPAPAAAKPAPRSSPVKAAPAKVDAPVAAAATPAAEPKAEVKAAAPAPVAAAATPAAAPAAAAAAPAAAAAKPVVSKPTAAAAPAAKPAVVAAPAKPMSWASRAAPAGAAASAPTASPTAPAAAAPVVAPKPAAAPVQQSRAAPSSHDNSNGAVKSPASPVEDDGFTKVGRPAKVANKPAQKPQGANARPQQKA